MKNKYEENVTRLGDLDKGDIFLTKDDSELIYLSQNDNDKHWISTINGSSWEVPNGDFPVFKIKDDKD